MENIKLDKNEYQVVKTLESDNWIYYYTLDINHDKEVVILCKNNSDENAKIEKVDEREFPILMNKFALK